MASAEKKRRNKLTVLCTVLLTRRTRSYKKPFAILARHPLANLLPKLKNTVESRLSGLRLSGYPIIRTHSSQFLSTDLGSGPIKTEGAATVTRYGVRLSSLLKEMYSPNGLKFRFLDSK